VKKRALCTDDEKRDPTNVLAACVLCDVAFERGWIALDEEQHVLISSTLPTTGALRQRLDQLEARIVVRPLNRDAVAFHRQHSFVP
jgi:predicted restriction endonuclease